MSIPKLEIDLDVLKSKKLMVATPMYGGQCTARYMSSCVSLYTELLKFGIPFEKYALENESLITRARNYCVDAFLKTDCTHLMFIDSDIEFNPMDVLMLLSLSSND